MSIKRLDVAGSIDNGGVELNGSVALGGVTLSGPDSVALLADGDDATYFQNTSSGPLDYMVRIDDLGAYSAADPVSLHLRWSMQTDFGTGTEGETFLFLQYSNPTNASGDYYVGQFATSWNHAYSLPGVYDQTIYDSVIPLIPRPAGTGSGFGVSGTTIEDCLAYLATGDCWLNVNEVRVADAGFVNGRIYEAWLEVGVAARVPPPRRQYPRPSHRVYPIPPVAGSTRTGPAQLL